MEKVKFVSVTRVIDQKSGVHFLDAVDSEGFHWMAEMRTDVEQWIIYSRVWKRDSQQPYK
jgi:hypothetical protein